MLLAVSGVLVGSTVACEPQTDPEPTVASVDFAPRLAIVATDDGLTVEVAPRGEGDDLVSADPARVPTGSIVDVSSDGPEVRIIGTRTPLEDSEAAPAFILDTGTISSGQSVTVGLTEPGVVDFYEQGDRDVPSRHIVVRVEPRPIEG